MLWFQTLGLKKKRSSAEMTSTKGAAVHKSNTDAESKYYGG